MREGTRNWLDVQPDLRLSVPVVERDIVTHELSRLDESEVVSLSFDEFSRQIEVEVNDREITSMVEDAVEEADLEETVDAFILQECMFKK